MSFALYFWILGLGYLTRSPSPCRSKEAGPQGEMRGCRAYMYRQRLRSTQVSGPGGQPGCSKQSSGKNIQSRFSMICFDFWPTFCPTDICILRYHLSHQIKSLYEIILYRRKVGPAVTHIKDTSSIKDTWCIYRSNLVYIQSNLWLCIEEPADIRKAIYQ